jgi:hypothetical protein
MERLPRLFRKRPRADRRSRFLGVGGDGREVRVGTSRVRWIATTQEALTLEAHPWGLRVAVVWTERGGKTPWLNVSTGGGNLLFTIQRVPRLSTAQWHGSGRQRGAPGRALVDLPRALTATPATRSRRGRSR